MNTTAKTIVLVAAFGVACCGAEEQQLWSSGFGAKSETHTGGDLEFGRIEVLEPTRTLGEWMPSTTPKFGSFKYTTSSYYVVKNGKKITNARAAAASKAPYEYNLRSRSEENPDRNRYDLPIGEYQLVMNGTFFATEIKKGETTTVYVGRLEENKGDFKHEFKVIPPRGKAFGDVDIPSIPVGRGINVMPFECSAEYLARANDKCSYTVKIYNSDDTAVLERKQEVLNKE